MTTPRPDPGSDASRDVGHEVGHSPSQAVSPNTSLEPGRDPWAHLRQHTPARIALGRTGVSLPTRELLDFALAHAQARDAIHLPLDTDVLCAELRQQGWSVPLLLHSQARDRHSYLLRPDLGRRLDARSVEQLTPFRTAAQGPDLVLVLGDGLSALGVQQHGAALLGAIRRALDPAVRLGPLVVVRQARVALADEVGERLGAAAVAMVVGERPGLSSPDSLGIYLTHAPRVGCSDAQRNCISNVRPAGQNLDTAARRLAWLFEASRRLGCTGVGLKDQSGLPLTELAAPATGPRAALG